MEEQKVDMYLMANNQYFEGQQIPGIRDHLLKLDDSKWALIQSVPLKDPKTALLISIFAGALGVDRFYIGDTGLGVGKLLTCGGLGIWSLIDWFNIQSATKQKNFLNLQQYLY